MVQVNALTAAPATLSGTTDKVPVYDASAGVLTQVTVQQLTARAYGDIKLAAATAAQTLSTSFAKLTVFDATTASYGVTVAGDFDDITVAQAGIYEIHFHCNFSSDASKTISFALSVGGTEDEDSQTVQVVTSGATNIASASFHVLKSLAASAVLTVEAKSHASTPAITFNNIDLVIKKIDEA
tara:strand:- start:4 stop:552 length:549 start_codon:yes stop_codon:yes gene_type:complete